MTARTEANIEKAVSSAMELATEQVVKYVKENVEGLSPYEIERNKPMPNLLHGLLQSKINLLLSMSYSETYMFPNELALATVPGSTPDICIYPLEKVDIKSIKSKEDKPPITTIEIQSPSQSLEELQKKAWDLYFPMGVKSAWIVIPTLKGIKVTLADGQELFYNSGNFKDPATGIELDLEKVFSMLK